MPVWIQHSARPAAQPAELRWVKILSEMNKNIAFLFPGQGSQYAQMGARLHASEQAFRDALDQCSAILRFALSKLCFEGPDEELKMTENTQPAIMTVSIAAFRVLAEHGIKPALAAGHSLGEWSAHVAAGTMSFADGVRAVKARGRAMQQAVPPGQGAMAAVLQLDAEKVAEACAAAAEDTGLVVAAANMNSPSQIVISGAVAAVERAAALCKERGARRAVMLPVSAPFHCALMQPAQEEVARVLSALKLSDPQIPVAANVSGTIVTTADGAREALVNQVTGAVRWVDCMRALIGAEAEIFVEVGPGKVLCGLLKQIDPAQKSMNVEDAVSLEKTLAELASA